MQRPLQNKLLQIYEEIKLIILCMEACQTIFVMGLLNIDRLICAVNPLKYKARMRVFIITNVLIACWVLSIIIGLIYGLHDSWLIKGIIHKLGIGLGTAYIVLAIITYIVIYISIRKSRRHLNHGTSSDRPMSWKFYIVSILIVATYIFLYLIPITVYLLIISSTDFTRLKCLIHEGMILIISVGLVSDAVIYIFMKKEFRDLVFAIFPFRKRDEVLRIQASIVEQEKRDTSV